MKANDSRILFFRWLAANHPKIYLPVAKRLAAEARLGDLAGWADTLVSALATVATAVVAKKTADRQMDAQKKQLLSEQAQRDAELKATLLSINLQRAQSGLPPVDEHGNVVSSSSLPSLPTSVQAQAAASSSGNFFGLPLWAWGVGVGAVIIALRS